MNATMPCEISGLSARADLTQEQRDEMFDLLSRYFEGVTRAQFEHDLAEKNWVIEIRRESRLVGFSTLLVTTSEFEGQPITVIYSGDTIVAPEAWGSPALARMWIAAVNRLRDERPRQRCYWLLLTSGFRTYRFLPVFWRDFFPRHDAAIDPSQLGLLRALATKAYGANFFPAEGVVRFSQPQRLIQPLAEIPDGRTADPHIAFFLENNRGHAQGDELVCLTEIAESNLTAAGRRMIARPHR